METRGCGEKTGAAGVVSGVPALVAVGCALLLGITAREGAALVRTGVVAPEFPQGLSWLNVSRPLSLEDLKGKVVLLDFWTYGCINCIHIIPDLKRLERNYGRALAVIGVHSPKFENEKNVETLRKIVVRYDRREPIVQDSGQEIWNAYNVPAWPTLVVIDPGGRIVQAFYGEGHYQELDRVIGRLVAEHGPRLNRTPLPIALEKEHLKDHPLAFPAKIAVSGEWLYIADPEGSAIRRVHLTEDRVETLIGRGLFDFGDRDGPLASARLQHPLGVGLTGRRVWLADTYNHKLKVIDLDEGRVRTSTSPAAWPRWIGTLC